MIKWELILGAEVLYEYTHDYKSYEQGYRRSTKIRNLIDQHSIIMSAGLRDFYESYFFENKEDDYDRLLQILNSAPSYADSPYVYYSTDIDDEIDEVMKELTRKINKSLIVCDSNDHYNACRCITRENRLVKFENLLDIAINNRIYRNSDGFSKDLFPSDLNDFFSWLREVFSGEKTIDIVDPYLGTHNVMSSFIDYYIERFEVGTTIKIYTYIDGQNDKITNALWKKFIDCLNNRKLNALVYDVSRANAIDDIHDRRIYLNSTKTHITIGHGLDTIKEVSELGETRTGLADCHVTIDKDMSKIIQIRKDEFKKTQFDYGACCVH